MADINRAEDYFRRSRDRGGDTKLLARGLLHLLKHLEMDGGRDFNRAQDLLDRAWKKSGSERIIADAMFLVSRELKKDSKQNKKKITSKVNRNEYGLIVGEELED